MTRARYVADLAKDSSTQGLIKLGSGATGYGVIPVGGVIAVQSGLTGAYSLPSTGAVSTEGWMLCDGATIPANQTLSGNVPTLNDARFLQGNTHANVGGTGGDTIPAHTHTGPDHQHSMPNHSHSIPSHGHSVGQPDHSNSPGSVGNQFIGVGSGGHGLHGSPPTPCSSSYWSGGSNANGINQSNWSGNTGDASGNTNMGGTGATGDGSSHSAVTGTAVLPKYLRVVYIIRVK